MGLGLALVEIPHDVLRIAGAVIDIAREGDRAGPGIVGRRPRAVAGSPAGRQARDVGREHTRRGRQGHRIVGSRVAAARAAVGDILDAVKAQSVDRGIDVDCGFAPFSEIHNLTDNDSKYS